ncbi:MAG: hypothetical protein ACI4K7_13065 [Oscillospiraceae bacterium]
MERIYFGGGIITMKSDNDRAEAVLTEDGRIKAVGRLQDIEAIARSGAERFDLEGRTMLPAFIDSHSHLSITVNIPYGHTRQSSYISILKTLPLD